MKEKNVVIMNPELEKALKGYVPEIANDEDIRIMNDLTKLHKKLKTIDCASFRKLAVRRQADLTSKMREIQSEEQYLIKRINQRNLDF